MRKSWVASWVSRISASRVPPLGQGRGVGAAGRGAFHRRQGLGVVAVQKREQARGVQHVGVVPVLGFDRRQGGPRGRHLVAVQLGDDDARQGRAISDFDGVSFIAPGVRESQPPRSRKSQQNTSP